MHHAHGPVAHPEETNTVREAAPDTGDSIADATSGVTSAQEMGIPTKDSLPAPAIFCEPGYSDETPPKKNNAEASEMRAEPAPGGGPILGLTLLIIALIIVIAWVFSALLGTGAAFTQTMIIVLSFLLLLVILAVIFSAVMRKLERNQQPPRENHEGSGTQAATTAQQNIKALGIIAILLAAIVMACIVVRFSPVGVLAFSATLLLILLLQCLWMWKLKKFNGKSGNAPDKHQRRMDLFNRIAIGSVALFVLLWSIFLPPEL